MSYFPKPTQTQAHMAPRGRNLQGGKHAYCNFALRPSDSGRRTSYEVPRRVIRESDCAVTSAPQTC